MQLAGRDRGRQPLAEDLGLGPNALGVDVEAITVAVRAGGGITKDDRFTSFADLVKRGLPDDLRRALGTGGEGFVVRHGLVITRPNGAFVEELVYDNSARRVAWFGQGYFVPQGTFECPVCGEDVPAKAKACPHCGACEKLGWNDETRGADGLDLAGGEFDYEKFAREEFGSPTKLQARQLIWKVITVIILVLMVAAVLFQFFLR
jgi:hypothetical protein